MAGLKVKQAGKAISSIAVILSVVTLTAVVGRHGVTAQSNCNSVLVSLAPCLNYITGNETTPSQGCCSAFSTVVKNNAQCLCQLLTGNNSLGIPIDETRALALPGLCKVTTPPVSRCQGSGAPTNSPSGTPGSSPGANTSPPDSLMSSVVNVVVGILVVAVLV